MENAIDCCEQLRSISELANIITRYQKSN